MIKGSPVNFDACPRSSPRGKCACGKCAVCGYQKHVSVHGGVIDRPGMVYDHEFKPAEKDICVWCRCEGHHFDWCKRSIDTVRTMKP